MRQLLALVLVVLVCGGCDPATAPPRAATGPALAPVGTGARHQSEVASRGLAFARAKCSGCHAVVGGQSSPNPQAPPFEDIVNARGVTSATLKPWLRDAHNFPEVMNFQIDSGQIDALAEYMMTLQKSDYTPPI